MMIESNDRFGKYALLERLAVGGMAEIFKAKAEGVDGFEKILAIKRLHRRLCEDADFTGMLVDEAKLAVQLQHANIGQVFDLGYINDQYFIVMEYIDGFDLHQLLRVLRKEGRRIPVEVALHIVAQACEALHYAHTKLGRDRRPLEIVHRDVSPQNVMLSLEGEVKLVDFGIAKARMRAQQTQAGIIKGKFYYMSPEQAYGHRIDARTDVYAVGILLYELFAGKNPYEDYDDSELLKRVRQSDFAPLGKVVDDVDLRLIQIVDKALQRNAELRFQSALELQRALLAYSAQNCPPFSRVEMAEYVRRSMGMDGVDAAQDRPSSQAMMRQEYAASDASIIYDASNLSTDEHEDFDEEERTRVFDRASGEHEHEFGDYAAEATSMLDFDSLPPPAGASGPFLDETREDQAMMARASLDMHEVHGPGIRDTQPQVSRQRTQSGASWQHLVRDRRIQLGGLVFFIVALLIGILTLVAGDRSSRDDASSGIAFEESATQGQTVLSIATVPPGAAIRMDGGPALETPVDLDNLQIGQSYELVFSMEDYSEMTLQVTATARMEPLIVRLEPLQGVLKISSYPPGATIRINGEDYGTSPVTAVGIPRDGTHRIEGELPDGRRSEQLLEWESGDERIKDIQLEFEEEEEEVAADVGEVATKRPRSPSRTKTSTASRSPRPTSTSPGAPVGRTANQGKTAPSAEPLNIWEIGAKKEKGKLNVRVSGDEEGRVFINNQATNRSTPLNHHELDPGTYSVRVYFPTFKRSSDTRRVTVRANETATVVFSP